MSTHDRLAISREIFESFLRGELAPLFSALDDHVELSLTIGAGTPLSGVFRGKAGVERYLSNNAETVEVTQMAVSNYLAGGDQVAVVGRETLIVKRSGEVVEDSDWITLFTFREAKIVKVLIVEDTSRILAAYHGAESPSCAGRTSV